MSQPPIDLIGRRIARYRKLNGWSARQLADNTDGALTRDTIANIETGRRTDITIRQLLAISVALRVPIVALLTDLDRPFEPAGIRFTGAAPAPLEPSAPQIALAAWLNAQTANDTTPAARWVAHVTQLLADYLLTIDTAEVHGALGRIAHAPAPADREHVAEQRDSIRAALLAAGVQMPLEREQEAPDTGESGCHGRSRNTEHSHSGPSSRDAGKNCQDGRRCPRKRASASSIEPRRPLPFKKVAFITGITGQDGSYLAELLLAKGYEVHGLIRRASTFNTSRIDHLYTDPHNPAAQLFLHYGDLSDGARLVTLLSEIKPQEVYNLGAQSHVRVSFDEPEHTGDTTGVGAMRLLEAVRLAGLHCRFYQASSSEMFGATPPPQDESTPFYPRSPYGAAKLYAYWVTKNYREGYGMYAVNGILFNHESPRRGETFVTRKITRAVARIKAGKQHELYMGNLDAVRDWGYAAEYVEGMWRMLQADQPDDYVLATNVGYTVREFLQTSFSHVGLDWQEYVKFDERYLRPTEVDALIGDATKARTELGWTPTIDGLALAKLMVDADVEALAHEGSPWIDTVRLDSWNSKRNAVLGVEA